MHAALSHAASHAASSLSACMRMQLPARIVPRSLS